MESPRSARTCLYVCIMYGITYSKGKNQTGKVANPARGQLKGEKKYFLAPVRFWSRETGSAVPSRVSLLISILRLNLVLAYGTPPDFRGGVHLFIQCSHSTRAVPPPRINIPRRMTRVTGPDCAGHVQFNKHTHTQTPDTHRLKTFVKSERTKDHKLNYLFTVRCSKKSFRRRYQIQPEYGNEQADAGRDCRTRLARPNSQARTGTGKYIIFPAQLADHEQDWQPFPVDSYPCYIR